MEDLEGIEEELKRFKEETGKNAENARCAIKIFEEIKKEKVHQVSLLFGKNGPVSRYFQEITGGEYEEVNFDSKELTLTVKRKGGEKLEVGKLSAGAYDQLYFSIRLTMAEILLEGKKGFFILDDPFIKYDFERLGRQIDILKRISLERGWQIIYFSAKKEIKEIFSEKFKDYKGYVEYEL